MDRKVLFGLLAAGAAVVVLSRGRRRRTAFSGLGVAPRSWKPKSKKAWRKGTAIERREHGLPTRWARKIAADHLYEKPTFYKGAHGLGSPPGDHIARYHTRIEQAERAFADAEQAIVAAMAARKGIARDPHGVNRRMLEPADVKYHLNIQCDRAAASLMEASRLVGISQAEKMGAGVGEGEKRMEGLGPLLRDILSTRSSFAAACLVQKPRGIAGLGLGPEAHTFRRTNASVQAGFKIKDAVKAARKGWCDSAIVALREAEYHAGQATAHAKSTEGEGGRRQSAKAQATRVAVNRAAREVKASCSVHRRRGGSGSAKQGKLPF